jgi:FkbM family methyltransferase
MVRLMVNKAVHNDCMLDQLICFMLKKSIPGVQKLFTYVKDVDSTICFSANVHGHKVPLRLNPCDYLDRQLIALGCYETGVLDELLTTPLGGALWDIGANIGLHSAAVAVLRPDLSVTSVEANPLLIGRLLANVGTYSNVSVVSCGLSRGFVNLPFSLNSSGNSGHSSFTPWSEVAYQRVITIPAIPASSIGISPNTVKIDVEGHELDVLSGFGNMAQNVSKFVIETKFPTDVHQFLGEKIFDMRQIGETHKGDYVFERRT